MGIDSFGPEAVAARQRVWLAAQRRRRPSNRYHSQFGQDRWLRRHVFGDRPGRFLDVGGYDGVTGSNSLFFERALDWSGILIEPVPSRCAEAATVRSCPCIPVAAGADDGTAQMVVVERGLTQTSALVAVDDPAVVAARHAHPHHSERVIDVPVRRLDSLLVDAAIDHLDYVSIDTEGSEHAVLNGFPFEAVRVIAWTIENRHHDEEVRSRLARYGYALRHRLGVDDVFVDVDHPVRTPR